ncbi:MAG TPA: hypothetical protein VKM94_07505 [Blastocatellia bacterium]|nr:hypothetical protein [Blastocatellia bacterium]
MKRVVILVIVLGLAGLCPPFPAEGWVQQSAQQNAPQSPPQHAQPTAPQNAPAAPAAATSKSATASSVDKPWPRSYDTAGGAKIVIHQPQIASWDNQRHLVGYAAVSYLADGSEKPALGTVKIEADTDVAVTERLVKLSSIKLTEASFQSLPKEEVREIVGEIEKTIPDDARLIGLDRVLTSIDKSQIIPKNVVGIKADAPPIYFSKTPAVLLNLDGDPIWSPIKDNDLKFAVNTNWDLFNYPQENTYYLRYDTMWLQAPDVKGPWAAAHKLPGSFKELPKEDQNWTAVRESLKNKDKNQVPAPAVFVSTAPAELISVQGEPKYVPVHAGGRLLWLSNTESDVFRLGETGPIYYLVAGRWFTASDFAGPWTFATPNLPSEFKAIPMEHPRSRVLASIPGTQQAAEAVLLAQVPQTARVNKKELKGPDVVYNGEPQFAPIESTSLARAVNTDKEIIKVGDSYYMCFEGVWFKSSAPTGPWSVADSVPAEIYSIPPSDPSHNVTYVTVKDEDKDDEWVEYAAVAGYTGMVTAWGCSVWGTGWYYPPYYWYGGYYPIYYPPMRTYGYGSWYNPRTGFYGSAGRIYGPYGGVGFGARYNPTTGTYARGAMAWGPNGARGAAQVWNPRTGTYAQTRQGSGVYGSWGSTSVVRGDQWAQTKRFTNREGTTTRYTRTDQGSMIRRKGDEGSGFVAKGQDNLYAGKDGNVYRRDESGNWSKWDNGGWNNVQKPERPTPISSDQARERVTKMDRSTYDGLQKDSARRSEGSRRTSDFSSYQNRGGGNVGSYRGGGYSRGGGYRGGGGFRGGGGRRR